jgi:phosphoglycolate phosphatase-like HAD superfamily hydrolase
MSGKQVLPNWTDGAARAAIVEFVERAVSGGVPVEERIAVFDADGTLWCEKPVPVEAGFVLKRLAETAEADSTLRDRQPWKAAYEHDGSWFSRAITEHYAGDDAKAQTLLGGITAAFAGMEVEEFEAQAGLFLQGGQHPTLGRGYLDTAYVPMLELLDYLEANGFSNLIVSGSGADFIRSIAEEVFGIPPERVVGSTSALEYTSDDKGGTITHKAALGFLDDGPQKPIQIWSRVGRRPLLLRAGTRTGTCRCSSSPSIRTRRRFAYSSSTTIRSGSSRTQAARRRPWRKPARAAGRS